MNLSTEYRVAPAELQVFVANALTAAGLPRSDAKKVAELIVLADLRGADGHGIFRLPQYVRRLMSGGINLHPKIRIVSEFGSTAIVDGDNGMGHLVVQFAAQAAIRIAEASGIGWVGVRGGNHAGPGALYVTMPLEQDMIGIYCAIGNANHMAPWGGVERLLSTNPIAIAIPTGQHPPLVLDMATSVVAYGAVKQLAQHGELLPEGWMIDVEGRPLRDSKRTDEGLLLPSGGYKGFGLSLMVTVLAGLLNGAAIGRDVVDFNHDETSPTNTGQAIAAIDVQRFCDVQTFKDGLDAFIVELKTSKRLPGVDQIRLPGEASQNVFGRRSSEGVPLNPKLEAKLNELAHDLKIEPIARKDS